MTCITSTHICFAKSDVNLQMRPVKLRSVDKYEKKSSEKICSLICFVVSQQTKLCFMIQNINADKLHEKHQ